MRCNWPTSANLFKRPWSHLNLISRNRDRWRNLHSAPSVTGDRARKRLITFSPIPTFGKPPHTIPRRFYNAEATDSYPKDVEVEDEHEVPVPAESKSLTDAQISRAAAQAVRLCFQKNAVEDAFTVVNSLYFSCQNGQQSHYKLPLRMRSRMLPNPINFGRPISARLSAHSLLHGLIRVGLTKMAAKEATTMVNAGIRIRSKTLEAAIDSLTATPNINIPSPGYGKRVSLDLYRIPDSKAVLTLRHYMVSDAYTRLAVRILLEARKHGQRRTKRMYQSLIHACLTQGEILVASLLFVLMVKDWQLRHAIAERVAAQMRENVDEPAKAFSPPHNQSDLQRLASSQTVFPSGRLLGSILTAINASYEWGHNDETKSGIPARHTLQALANLAMLLDERRLPFNDLSFLVKTMYSCPRSCLKVWIKSQPGYQTEAYKYFHDTLLRFIRNLPSGRTKWRRTEPKWRTERPAELGPDMLPPLDHSSCNSLLQYTLRHRLSLSLAERVLRYMGQRGIDPLDYDTVTYNTLLRSGTLLRRNDISDQALERLYHREENEDVTNSVPLPSDSGSTQELLSDKAALSHLRERQAGGRFRKILQRLRTENFSLPEDLSISSPSPVANGMTLTAYITHLTSTGHPHAVANILFHVLPELRAIDHPSWGSLSQAERGQLRRTSRQECVRRVTAHGPYFFAAVLNALRKAGKTGLAERVWLLAKEAERASWVPGFCPDGVEPWCLSIHAYTTMMQCYAAEAKKGLDILRVRRGGLLLVAQLEQEQAWTPHHNRHVRGWAYFVLSASRLTRHDKTRHNMARRMGYLLYRSMQSGARDLYNTLLHIKNKKGTIKPLPSKGVDIPQPDARFYNTALDLFGRNSHMRARRWRPLRTRWVRKLRITRLAYNRDGMLPRNWSPMLQAIAQDIVRSGYAIPDGFRHLFVGRWEDGTLPLNNGRGHSLVRRPYGFPITLPIKYNPYSIPVFKRRGLPLSTTPHLRLKRRRHRTVASPH